VIKDLIIDTFKAFIWHFYHHNKRDFAWRNSNNPYHILVSEVMLQQTQTHRVIQKYEQFIDAFATIESLAEASLRDVLSVWQGLGYYRRARFLHQLAQKIVAEHGGVLPQDPHILKTLPGIGINTAGSVCAFAFNQPTIFIETNIRTVFIDTFFKDRETVSDKEIMVLVEQHLDYDNPREWYYALMDYGVFLKSGKQNPSRKSSHYTKQSKFEGSDRQLRAKILKYIVAHEKVSREDIFLYSQDNKDRVEKIITLLINEQFIGKGDDDTYTVL
jgi:A/G-specific adenine glycosylase